MIQGFIDFEAELVWPPEPKIAGGHPERRTPKAASFESGQGVERPSNSTR
jgi:hypothetical protein